MTPVESSALGLGGEKGWGREGDEGGVCVGGKSLEATRAGTFVRQAHTPTSEI